MTAYQVINAWFDWINKRSPILLLTPYSRNLGNCAEEIYFGLLKARREGKKALFLFPRGGWGRFHLAMANRDLLEIESPYCLPNQTPWCRAAGWLLTFVFLGLGQTYLRGRRLRQMLSRLWPRIRPQLLDNISYVIPTVGRSGLWQPDGVAHFSSAAVERCCWKRQFDEPLPVELGRERLERAERIRMKIGLPDDGWYACLHVRDFGFRNDAALNAARGTSILSYLDGIRAITAAGGWVVRLGDPSMPRLPPMERVIDYSHSAFKSELMDVYLICRCRFFIGVNSGPLEVAWLFQKPVVLTNLTEWTLSFPRRKGDLAIVKHLFSRSRKRFLSLREMRDESFACQFALARKSSEEYVAVENTGEEIRDVVVEFLTTPLDCPHSDLQRAFNHGRRRQIHRWLGQDRLVGLNAWDDVVEKYRFASRADAVEGALSRTYLEQNWVRDSLNDRPECAPGGVVASRVEAVARA